jgi:hypothetical protein
MTQHFDVSPRLVLSSPEPGSGKTRVLELLNLLVPHPMFALNASPATIFRKLHKEPITLLFDEVDAIWSKQGKDDNNQELRGLLNAGYKRGAKIPRCVGQKHEVVDFEVFAPVALAGIGELPDTILTRAVIIKMRRRSPSESVEPFRERLHGWIGEELQLELAKWGELVGKAAGDAWPQLPEGIVDRAAEIWEPLIAIADAAGDAWPAAAREACVSLCASALDRRASLGVRLLADLRLIFGDELALHTQTIRARLCNGEAFGLEADAPWADLYGKEITERKLASMLRQFSVKSTKVKVDGVSLQGYRRDSLWDAWRRYVPLPSARPEPVEPSEFKTPIELLRARMASRSPDGDASRDSTGSTGSERANPKGGHT